ncbi:MAG: class D beta-lactamase [Xanthomonadales bacterium]|nr:class D beta-lactamase [Xanthomonadales bacterium]
MARGILFFAALLASAALSSGAAVAAQIADADRTALVYNLDNDQQWQWNSARAPTRYTPCSTFKLPNALIGLESGAISLSRNGAGYDIVRDPLQPWWPDSWPRSQDLSSALKNSTVWYFQALARKIGMPSYASWLHRFHYGNQNTDGGIDQFWLGSSLRISAIEQIRFLAALERGQLGVKPEYVSAITDSLVLEQGQDWRMWGKTGGCLAHDGRWIGWLVGALRKPGGHYVYAVNVSSENWDVVRGARIDIARQALKDAGAL